MFKSVLLVGDIAALGSVSDSLVLFDLKRNRVTKSIKLGCILVSDMFLFKRLLLLGGRYCVYAVDLDSMKTVSFPQPSKPFSGIVRKLAVYERKSECHFICANDQTSALTHLVVSDFFAKYSQQSTSVSLVNSKLSILSKQADYLKTLYTILQGQPISAISPDSSKLKENTALPVYKLSKPRSTANSSSNSGLFNSISPPELKPPTPARVLKIQASYCKVFSNPQLYQLQMRLKNFQKVLSEHKNVSKNLLEQLNAKENQVQTLLQKTRMLKLKVESCESQLKARAYDLSIFCKNVSHKAQKCLISSKKTLRSRNKSSKDSSCSEFFIKPRDSRPLS